MLLSIPTPFMRSDCPYYLATTPRGEWGGSEAEGARGSIPNIRGIKGPVPTLTGRATVKHERMT
jgi:hypothetical protein